MKQIPDEATGYITLEVKTRRQIMEESSQKKKPTGLFFKGIQCNAPLNWMSPNVRVPSKSHPKMEVVSGEIPETVQEAIEEMEQYLTTIVGDSPTDAGKSFTSAGEAGFLLDALRQFRSVITTGDTDKIAVSAMRIGYQLCRVKLLPMDEVAIAGKRAYLASQTGNAVKQSRTAQAQELARTEYIRRQAINSISKEATLQNMQGMVFGTKQPKLGTLRRWAKSW